MAKKYQNEKRIAEGNVPGITGGDGGGALDGMKITQNYVRG